MANTLELIKQRRSVRSFDGKNLTEEEKEKILSYAEQVENPYGLAISWKILDAKAQGLSTPVIVGTDTFIAGKMEKVPHGEEAFGYAFEKVVLYCQSLGIGTTWIAGTMDRPAFEKAMELSDKEVMPCVSPLGYPASKMSLRETLMRKGVKADSRLKFEELFFENSFDTPLTKAKAANLLPALETVQWGPSAVNKQPWRLVFAKNKVHFFEKHSRNYESGGWDIQKIDMGIALCHFEMLAEENGIKTSFQIQDPGIPRPEDTEYIGTFVMG